VPLFGPSGVLASTTWYRTEILSLALCMSSQIGLPISKCGPPWQAPLPPVLRLFWGWFTGQASVIFAMTSGTPGLQLEAQDTLTLTPQVVITAAQFGGPPLGFAAHGAPLHRRWSPKVSLGAIYHWVSLLNWLQEKRH